MNFMVLNNMFSQNLGVILILLICLLIISLVLSLVSLVKLGKAKRRYKQLLNGSSSDNIEEKLIENGELLNKLIASNNNVQQQAQIMQGLFEHSLQKFSIYRFCAFEDMGGDTSYAMAVLNNRNDGFILSTIHGRHESRTYLKPVEQGKSSYQLSAEETKVLEEASNQ